MVTSEKEYERALENPENFIVSEELQGIFSVDDVEQNEDSPLHAIVLNGQSHVFNFTKVKRLETGFYKFKGHVPTFPIVEYLRGASFKLEFHRETFSLVESEPASFNNDGILTFTARRIIRNEEVPV